MKWERILKELRFIPPTVKGDEKMTKPKSSKKSVKAGAEDLDKKAKGPRVKTFQKPDTVGK